MFRLCHLILSFMEVVCQLEGPGFGPGGNKPRGSCRLVLSKILGLFIERNHLVLGSLLRLLGIRAFFPQKFRFSPYFDGIRQLCVIRKIMVYENECHQRNIWNATRWHDTDTNLLCEWSLLKPSVFPVKPVEVLQP